MTSLPKLPYEARSHEIMRTACCALHAPCDSGEAAMAISVGCQCDPNAVAIHIQSLCNWFMLLAGSLIATRPACIECTSIHVIPVFVAVQAINDRSVWVSCLNVNCLRASRSL